jgi:hypothetical protein
MINPDSPRRAFIAICALTLGALLARAALGEGQPCGDRTSILTRLGERYGETRRGAGLMADVGVLEIYSNPDTGSWTILLTNPNGLTCLIAAGEGWVQDAPATKTPGEPS